MPVNDELLSQFSEDAANDTSLPSNEGQAEDALLYDPKVLDMAREFNVPNRMAQDSLPVFERQSEVNKLANTPMEPNVRKAFNDPTKSSYVATDVDNLNNTERQVNRNTGMNFGIHSFNPAASIAAAIPSITEAGYDILYGVSKAADWLIAEPLSMVTGLPVDDYTTKPLGEFFKWAAEGQADLAESVRPAPSGNVFIDAVGSGIESGVQNLVLMGAGVLRGAEAGGFVLKTMSAMEAGRSFKEADDQGLGFVKSAMYATVNGSIEYATELIPVNRLFKDLQLDTLFVKMFATNMMGEQVGEQIATALQDLNAWANLPENVDQTFNDYLLERPNAALQTFISTLVAVGVTTSVSHVATRKARGDARENAKVDAMLKSARLVMTSQDDQEKIDALIELSQASKINSNAQEVYKDFLAGLGSDKQVFVPEDILWTVEALLPASVKESMDGSTADVGIPMDTFMTDVTGNDQLMEALRPHLKMGEDRMSADQIAKDDGSTTRALLERAQAAAEANTEATEMWDSVSQQLVETGRMSADTARMSAALYPAFATVMAERYDMSVKEVFDKMNLHIIGPDQRASDVKVEMNQSTLDQILREFDALGLTDNISETDRQSIFDTPAPLRQKRLLEVTGLAQDAAWTDDRLDRVIAENQSVSGTDSRIAFVNPASFVNSTHPDPQIIADEAGDLDVEKLKGETQTPFIWIGDQGEIVAHEGRHRMAALAAVGVERVPVRIRFMEGADYADVPSERRRFKFKGQEFDDGAGESLDIDEAYLALPENRDVIKKAMGDPELLFQATNENPLAVQLRKRLDVLNQLKECVGV